jgi:hypothetical protein
MEKDATGCPSLPTHTGLRTPAQAVPRQPPTLPHVRFGGGPTEKGRFDRYLAGGLPYLLTRSPTGIASALTPPFNWAIRFSWSQRSLARNTTSEAGVVRLLVM